MTTPFLESDRYVDADSVHAVENTMDTVLTEIVDVFTAGSVDLPDRQYLWWGPTAWDCEQVTVSVLQLYLGPPGDQASLPQRCDGPRTLVIQCQVVRRIPLPIRGAEAPPKTDCSNYARLRGRDAWLLMEAGLKACDQWGVGAIADVNPTDPQGEFQAVVLNLTLPVV